MQLCWKEWEKENNAYTDKGEEKKWTGSLAKKDALEGMVNGKKAHRKRRYQMIDNMMIKGLYADRKRKAEKTVEWRKMSLQ